MTVTKQYQELHGSKEFHEHPQIKIQFKISYLKKTLRMIANKDFDASAIWFTA
jgi:hypothetical protein